jgi:hypothetical protein
LLTESDISMDVVAEEILDSVVPIMRARDP